MKSLHGIEHYSIKQVFNCANRTKHNTGYSRIIHDGVGHNNTTNPFVWLVQ